jgi:hypothetical protein
MVTITWLNATLMIVILRGPSVVGARELEIGDLQSSNLSTAHGAGVLPSSFSKITGYKRFFLNDLLVNGNGQEKLVGCW